jgi:AraC-like DNA-binding protein
MEGESAATVKAVADGLPGIMFHQTEAGLFLNRTKKLSTVFLYGQTVKPIELLAPGKFRMIGLYFHPHVMKSIFGFNSSELTDGCLDLTLLADASSRTLAERLLNTSPLKEQIGILADYLSGIISMNESHVDNLLQIAIRHLMNSDGRISLGDLQRNLNVSQRTFERRFEQYVGIPPKLFARICRFQAALKQLADKEYLTLTDVAFDNGYADQSHFIRSFKEFANLCPGEFQEHSTQFVLPDPIPARL